MTPPRADLTAAIEALLAAEGFPIDVARAPDLALGTDIDDNGRLLHPYVVVWPLPRGVVSGSWDDRSAFSTWLYQVTSVGRSEDMAQRCADRMRARWCIRTVSGDWANPLDVPGVHVVRRGLTETGGPTPTGTDTYEVHDTFEVIAQ